MRAKKEWSFAADLGSPGDIQDGLVVAVVQGVQPEGPQRLAARLLRRVRLRPLPVQPTWSGASEASPVFSGALGWTGADVDFKIIRRS